MALKRNPAWIADLEDRETFISFAEDPKIGMSGLFGEDWHTVGIETDDSTAALSRELTESTTVGAGYGVVSRSYKPGALNSSIDALEENPVVDYIEWPDTARSADGKVLGRRHSSKIARAHVARVTVRNDGIVKIQVTRVKAYLTIAERPRGDAAAGKTITINYVPDSDKFVFEDRCFKVEGGEAVEFTPKRFAEDSAITGTEKVQIGGTGAEASDIEFEVIDDTPAPIPPVGG